MKQIFFYLMVFYLAIRFELKAQDSINKTYIGIELSYVNPAYYKDGFFPTLTLSKGKHLFFTGAAIMYRQFQSRPMSGALAGYRVYPNGTKKRFNLFFDYTFSFLKGKFEDDFTSYVLEMTIMRKGRRSSDVFYLDNYFGFGFQLNVLKNLYVVTGSAINIGLYKEEYAYTYQDGSTFETHGKLALRKLNNLGVFKIGLGYKFAVPKNSQRNAQVSRHLI